MNRTLGRPHLVKVSVTNTIAYSIAALIVVILLLDQLWLDLDLPVLIGKTVDDVIRNVAFWN